MELQAGLVREVIGSKNVGLGSDLAWVGRGEERGRRGVSEEEEERIASFGRKFSEMVESRGFSESLEEFRGDTISDIHDGLNFLATGIKIVTTILTLFGAESVDR